MTARFAIYRETRRPTYGRHWVKDFETLAAAREQANLWSATLATDETLLIINCETARKQGLTFGEVDRWTRADAEGR